jgi:transposase
LDGLKDKPRNGRPPLVNNDLTIKIRKQLSDSNFGWDFRQVMNIIQKRTGVKYHEDISTGCFINGGLYQRFR